MTEKEWKIIDEEFISYTGGTAQLISNGECKVHLWETPKDAQLFCDKLNEQHEQIEDLKDANVRCCNEYSYFHKRMMELEKENEQLKSTIAQLIEQNRKNSDLLLSDIRILEKALWCGGCENDYGRDNKMIDTHCKIKIWNEGFEDSYCQSGCPLNELKGDVE